MMSGTPSEGQPSSCRHLHHQTVFKKMNEAQSKNEANRIYLLILGLAFALVLICGNFAGVQIFSASTYLVLHLGMETIAIAVALMIFALGWNAHAEKISGNLVWLGCVFFMVGWLDLSHTASYVGMPDFFTHNDSEKHLYFWLAARFLGTFSLLGLAFIPSSVRMARTARNTLFATLVLLVLALHWLIIVHQDWLPHLFSADSGLTGLKKKAEYFFMVVNVATISIILLRKDHTPRFNNHYIVGSAAVMIMSGLFFTLYTSLTGALVLAGHIYKVIAYILIYRAVVVDSIVFPFRELEGARSNLELAVEASATGMIMVDSQGSIVLTNRRAQTMFGYDRDAFKLQSIEDLIPVALRPRHAKHQASFFANPAERQMGAGRELSARRSDGRSFSVEIGLTPMSRENERFVIASVVDISSEVENSRRIEELVNYDPLTGLPNRNYVKISVENAIEMAAGQDVQFCILFMDVDQFKNVNDNLGHRTGDDLLIEVGKRLRAVVGPKKTVSRMGGDEFLVVLPSCKPSEAVQFAEKLLTASSLPYEIGAHTLSATLSVGIATFPDDGRTFDALYQHADAAMYRVKRDGRNGYSFFTEELHARNARILALDTAMHEGLREGQFYLEYQPQVSADGRKVVGLEALLRWKHPRLGQVSPVEFIPVAESSGLIIPLGTWVIQTATRQMRSWIDAGMAPRIVAVNLSAVQFKDPALLDVVSRALEESDLPPEYLELELTESVTMGDPESALATMDALSSRGIRLSIDDFGTGYSSLSYLKRFKIYKLKIDRSFVRDIAVDADDRAIVSAIIQMSHGVGFVTIAEGVETTAQLDFLRTNGCDEIQGYLFSKPISATDVLGVVRRIEVQTR